LKNASNVRLAHAYADFLERCGTLYWMALSKHEIMLRGAISAARDFVAESEVFVAPTLLRCYEIEKMQDWAGIGVDADNIALAVGPLVPPDEIVCPNYLVPIKGDPLGVGYMLNPTLRSVRRASGTKVSVSTVIERLRENVKNEALPDDAKVKIRNTIKYIEWCAEQ